MARPKAPRQPVGSCVAITCGDGIASGVWPVFRLLCENNDEPTRRLFHLRAHLDGGQVSLPVVLNVLP